VGKSANGTSKLKIPAVRVASDDCPIYIGRTLDDDGKIDKEGTPYYIHEREWIEVIPVQSVDASLALAALIAGDETNGTRESNRAAAVIMGESLTTLCEEIAGRIVKWNWTDLEGEALPDPHNEPDVIRALSNDELLYLVGAIRGETPTQRGNESTLSPDTSSTPAAVSDSPPKPPSA